MPLTHLFGCRSALVGSTGRKWVSQGCAASHRLENVTKELWDPAIQDGKEKPRFEAGVLGVGKAPCELLSFGLVQGMFGVCLCQRH